MIKKTGLQIDDQNLQRATEELNQIGGNNESQLVGLGTIDSDKTYSDINNLTNVASENTFHQFHKNDTRSEYGLNLNFEESGVENMVGFKNFPEVCDKLGDKTFNTMKSQNMASNLSKELNCSKIEKIPSEVGNSTISNVYNLAFVDDKENHFTANSRKDISAHQGKIDNIHGFKNQALKKEVQNHPNPLRKIQSNLPVLQSQNTNSSNLLQ
jgi:hypothetical protein